MRTLLALLLLAGIAHADVDQVTEADALRLELAQVRAQLAQVVEAHATCQLRRRYGMSDDDQLEAQQSGPPKIKRAPKAAKK